MIQSVWKNLTGLQKAAEHLWCDFITHHQTLMTYGYIWIQSFHTLQTGATEMEIQFLSTFISLLPQFGSAFFSSKEGVPVLLSI